MTPRLPAIGEQPYGPVFLEWLLAGRNADGRLKGVPNVINVRDDAYGAVGDGVADDTAKIQAAIDAANAVASAGFGMPPVFLPAVRGSDGYVASTLRYYPGTQILGAGSQNTAMLQKAGTADFLFKSNDASAAADNVLIADLFLNGFSNQGASLGAVDFTKGIRCRAERLWIDGFAGSSIRFKGGGVGGDVMYGTVLGCKLENMVAGGIGVELQSSASSQPDGTNILDSVVSAAAGTTAFKIVGTASRGADAVLIAFNRTIVVATILDSDGVSTRLLGNRFEVTSGNMTFAYHPTGGATTIPAFHFGNAYAVPGTLAFTNTGPTPIIRRAEIQPSNLRTDNGGTSTQTPGAVATVNIAHGLAAAPLDYLVQAGDANARGAPAFYVTADATNIILNFASNLTAATSYTWRWRAEI